MSDLFNLPETLSPRLAWMKRHGVKTYHTKDFTLEEHPWAAWVGDLEEAIAEDQIGTGETEDESIVDLAKLLNIPLWNEEGFK